MQNQGISRQTVTAFHPPWFDPSMPTRERCVLSALLDRAYEDCPQKTFAVFDDGSKWTYAELYHRARCRAAGLQALGVKRGERVLVWLPNGGDGVLTWFAINLLGACCVPINTAYRGALLAHVIANSEARIMVAHHALIERLADIDTAGLETVIAVGGPVEMESAGIRFEPGAILNGREENLVATDDLMPWDLQSIIYTSGTTGPSKGVLSSYFHQYTIATVIHGHMSGEDRIFVNGPMFHAGGTGSVYAALIYQASVALIEGFKVSTFWEQIRDTGSTLTSGLLGSMAPFLAKAGEAAMKEGTRLRRTHFYPLSETTIGLAQAFDFEYFSGYGMTELPFILVTDLNSRQLGSCGRPRSGIEARLVDEHDLEVAPGEVGELIARTDQTWSFMSGYNGMPEATVNTLRNGWYHSGDLFRQDELGNYYFLDRSKDAIRRRGENISSQEVENVVYAYPAVQDAAAFGVSSEYGEDDVMIAVSPRTGEIINPVALLEFLANRMAHFMLPRYIRVLDALPQTPTNKVQKHLLRDEAVTADTWDRDAAGITIRRMELS